MATGTKTRCQVHPIGCVHVASQDKDKTVSAARHNGKQQWTNPQKPDGLCGAAPLLWMLDLILMAASGTGIATFTHSPWLFSAPFSLAPFSSCQMWLGLDSPPALCSLQMLPTPVLLFSTTSPSCDLEERERWAPAQLALSLATEGAEMMPSFSP